MKGPLIFAFCSNAPFQDDIVLPVGVGGQSRAVLGALTHQSNGNNTTHGAVSVAGVPAVTGGELAALVAHTNPGYHNYMSHGRRRGSEAFG